MTAAPATGARDALATLVERFERDVMDVPGGSAVVRLECDGTAWDARITSRGCKLEAAGNADGADALISADEATWRELADDVGAGMVAFRGGRLGVRRNLHIGVGFLAATSGATEAGRLRFARTKTGHHDLAYLEAGEDRTTRPLVCIHGLGGTKASFLTTVRALSPEGRRVIALDLPGFGDSHKPLDGRYNARWFAGAVRELLDELEIERADLAGNSMGGRVAIELGLIEPDRVGRLALLSPALAWLRDRGWRWLLSAPLPHLGLIQPTPRWAIEPIVRLVVPGARDGWTAAGVDEFLRAYLTRRGRVAFYESARNIYMDEPHGDDGFWLRLASLTPEALFFWGVHDELVPVSFSKHVESVLPAARHVVQNCGHVPQMELPEATHSAMAEFLGRDERR